MPRRGAAVAERAAIVAIVLALVGSVAPVSPSAADPLPSATADPGDPLFAQQWNLQMINAPLAWETSTGAGTRIALIDGGIDRAHPDLAGKIVGGATFRGCAHVTDGCGDGDYRDHLVPGETPSQHGIATAGIAAAATGNGEGIAGVAPDAGILGIKAGNSSYAMADIVASIRWAVDSGADVISMSLGGLLGLHTLQRADTALLDAVEYARDHDVVVVAAAGNVPTPLCNPPAYYAEVLCVVAVDQHEQRTWYTAFGRDERGSAVAAPAGQSAAQGLALCDLDVPSTISLHNEQRYCDDGLSTGYGWFSGTSAATPHVAGVAALLAAQCRSADEIVRVIEETARNPLTDERGEWGPVWGYGIVDAAAAVATPVEELRTRRRPGLDTDPCVEDGTEGPVICAATWTTDFPGTLPDGWSTDLALSNGSGSWFAYGDSAMDFFTGRTGVSSWARNLGAKDDRLVSHRFPVSSTTAVRFSHFYAFEDGRDGGVVEITTDDGASWHDIGVERFTMGGYGGAIPGTDGPRPAWTGAPDGAAPAHDARILSGPTVSSVDLSHFAGEEVRLRWRLLQDGQRSDSLPGYEWHIDRVHVRECR